MAGFRVPLDCVRGHQGRYAALCSVQGSEIRQRVSEFVRSRYPQVQLDADGAWRVQTPTGSLQVTVQGSRADFLVIPADATAVSISK